uniref:Dynamin N-terminal domain-containing protein n=1 Tax=viral metagenome TaxID=1070528 RepID=A0A6C0BVT5_9ZZZZ
MNYSKIYSELKKINNELICKFITDNNIKELDFLFKNHDKKPNLALLGQSGSGKSTLINKLLDDNVLDSSDGKGAVTQYPIEIKYNDEIKYDIISDLDVFDDEYKLREILMEKDFCSNYSEELLTDDNLKNEISDQIDVLKNIELTYKIKKSKKKYDWKKFNKDLYGNVNDKYHFKYNDIYLNVSPFIKKIIIYINNDIIKNINLVDLPGTQDKMKLRTDKTNNYLKNETDFIIMVESNERARSSSFIDKALNNHVVNIIVTKRISDILLAITKIDRTLDSIKEEKLDELDSDEELDIDDHDNIIKEYEKRLNDTEIKLKEDIRNNHSLKIHNIESENINIKFYSKNDNESIGSLKKYINDICFKRKEKYNKIIYNLLYKYYEEIKNYIESESVEEEEKEKIKNLLNDFETELNNKLLLKISTNYEIIGDSNFNKILEDNEEYRNKLINTHGITLTSVLQKKYHVSCHDEIFHLVEDLSTNYKKFWMNVVESYIKEIDCKYNHNILLEKNLQKENIMKIKSIGENDLIQKIQSNLINSSKDYYINEEYIKYKEHLHINGNNIIHENINKNINHYSILSRLLYGDGTSNICRKYIEEMLSINKNKNIRIQIVKDLKDLLDKTTEDIINFQKNEIKKTINKTISKYDKIELNIQTINEILDTIKF